MTPRDKAERQRNIQRANALTGEMRTLHLALRRREINYGWRFEPEMGFDSISVFPQGDEPKGHQKKRAAT